MEINKIYEEVHDYCYNLILNSKKEDWSNKMIIIDNIKIEIFYNKRFHINIYNDNSAFNKKLKKLRKKYKEIKFFIENTIYIININIKLISTISIHRNKEKCEKAIQI